MEKPLCVHPHLWYLCNVNRPATLEYKLDPNLDKHTSDMWDPKTSTLFATCGHYHKAATLPHQLYRLTQPTFLLSFTNICSFWLCSWMLRCTLEVAYYFSLTVFILIFCTLAFYWGNIYVFAQLLFIHDLTRRVSCSPNPWIPWLSVTWNCQREKELNETFTARTLNNYNSTPLYGRPDTEWLLAGGEKASTWLNAKVMYVTAVFQHAE